jgi:multiple antibiotic resistance protein
MTIDIELISKAVISMLVMTSPFDPIKIMFFNDAISHPPRSRSPAAAKIAAQIIIVLGATALAGRQLLDLLSIDLDVFGAVGGILIAIIGFKMLSGSGTGRKQGDSADQDAPEEADTLLIPLTMPLIVGPGAIATTIAISSQGESNAGVVAASIAAGLVALSAFVSYAWLGNVIAKLKPAAVTVAARVGGLLLATIGTQMLLTGLKNFFV